MSTKEKELETQAVERPAVERPEQMKALMASNFDNVNIEEFMEGDLDVDSLLGHELNALTIQERNALFERIHGVENAEAETEEFVSNKLKDLKHELKVILDKPAYSNALRHGRSYVTSRKFELMFLRADLFDVRSAANRIVEFMKEKLKRFGSSALSRPLTLDDLSTPARTLLFKKGMFQLLPARDRVGRALLLSHHHFSNYRNELKQDPQSPGDAFFYVLMAAAEDEDTQKKGIVSFIVIDKIPHISDLEFLRLGIEQNVILYNVLPFKLTANHVWFSGKSSLVKNVFGMIAAGIGKQFLLETKLHTGSYEETKYALMAYGFPVDHLPFSLDGRELRLTAHQKWLRRRPAKEAEAMANVEFEAIDIPGCHDVCLQRGTSFHQHPGNLFMRAQMQLMMGEYQTARGIERKALNLKVIQAVRNQGGRFLSKKPGGWFEEIKVEAEVNKCIGASFRSMLARNAKQVGNEDSEDNEKSISFVELYGSKRRRFEDCCLPNSCDGADDEFKPATKKLPN